MAKITFEIPNGLSIPEGTEEGEEVEYMASFRLEKGGKLCLLEIDGQPLPGYDDKGKDTKESEPSFSDRYHQALNGPPA